MSLEDTVQIHHVTEKMKAVVTHVFVASHISFDALGVVFFPTMMLYIIYECRVL